ncbi:type IV conjugative transfer system protein TraL [Chachezhania sediminis]|uniref:type IV conjugative transfer system protein TraL n=1 Tax=Chachezhania sediminis TaxID=2599291 RepID=UPI00131D4A1C|nr:type IV conjugative transfer system protein TraL [Chachezhania sediminis]
MVDVIRVEQRLQDPPQFFVIPADEAIAAALPLMVGLMTRNLIPGLAAGMVAYILWKRVKGRNGLPGLAGRIYWLTPRIATPFRSFPDSAVAEWRA